MLERADSHSYRDWAWERLLAEPGGPYCCAVNGQCNVWTHLDSGVNGVCFCQAVRCHQTGIWWCAGSCGCNSEGPSQAGVMGWQKLREIQQEKMPGPAPGMEETSATTQSRQELRGKGPGGQWEGHRPAVSPGSSKGRWRPWPCEQVERQRARGFIIFLCSVLIRPLLHTQYRTDNNKLDQNWRILKW